MALTGTIGNDPAKFDPDYIYESAALPNATDATSDEFMLGRTQGGVQLDIIADTTVDIANGESLTIELLHDAISDEEGGNFLDSVVIYDETASGSAITFEIADTIINYIATDDVESFNKLKITTSGDESGDKITAFPTTVSQ